MTVLGGGPCGLATAIMLARRGHSVEVYERLKRPPEPCSQEWESGERSYNIGISGRGQNVLGKLGVMDLLDQYSSDVRGRKDWAPGAGVEDFKEILYTTKSYVTKCIQRDRLVSVLLSEIESTYKETIKIHYNAEVRDIRFNDRGKVELKVGYSCMWQPASLVIGCDGGCHPPPYGRPSRQCLLRLKLTFMRTRMLEYTRQSHCISPLTIRNGEGSQLLGKDVFGYKHRRSPHKERSFHRGYTFPPW